MQPIGGVKFQSRPASLARLNHRQNRGAASVLPVSTGTIFWPASARESPFIWRDKIPVCEDSKCICPGSCISEIVCPDGTGFIVREGLPQQGYRIDLEFCRGCGLCAQVCVGSALTMVDEDKVRKRAPRLCGISTVEPHWKEASRSRQRPTTDP